MNGPGVRNDFAWIDFSNAAVAAPSIRPTPPAGVRDGRYEGANPQLRVDLRLDARGSGAASCDLYRRETFGETYVASVRTAPGVALSGAAGVWPAIAEGPDGQVSTGTLRLDASTPASLVAELRLDTLIAGLAQGVTISFLCEWRSPHLRRLGLEVEQEQGVAPPPTATIGGAARSIPLALEAAGFEVYGAGQPSALPVAPAGGWSEKSLEHLMRTYAQSDLSRPGFELRLMWLSKSNRPGLLGVMFDSDDAMPRQGLAVFAQEIRERFGADADRKLIQTSVHEIGHALNLAHRFEREVGRADSTSFMNYDWRYRGGGAEAAFWSAFSFSFDTDELSFLRHGGLRQVSPGGGAFHSVRYWADGTGGYSPYVPEAPLPGLKLELLPPARGLSFRFGQPVMLGLRLTNTGQAPINVPDFLLDPKAGFVEFLIRRLDLADPDGGQRRAFSPIVDRCYDAVPERIVRLDPGQSHQDNAQLHFGAGGFAFAEPGFYEVTALLVVHDSAAQRDLIARSASLRVRVAYPDSEEERDASTMFSQPVGRWFALGGTIDTRAADLLQELAERRTHRVRGKGRAEHAARDPILANIRRFNSFLAMRSLLGVRDGQVFEAKASDPELARELAVGLTDAVLTCFDPVTASETARFRDGLLRELPDKTKD